MEKSNAHADAIVVRCGDRADVRLAWSRRAGESVLLPRRRRYALMQLRHHGPLRRGPGGPPGRLHRQPAARHHRRPAAHGAGAGKLGSTLGLAGPAPRRAKHRADAAALDLARKITKAPPYGGAFAAGMFIGTDLISATLICITVKWTGSALPPAVEPHLLNKSRRSSPCAELEREAIGPTGHAADKIRAGHQRVARSELGPVVPPTLLATARVGRVSSRPCTSAEPKSLAC